MSDRGEAEFSHRWADLDGVQEVLVVRERTGMPYKKVRYIALPQFLQRFPVTKSLTQLILAFVLAVFTRPDVICSVQMNPHGYYGYLISRVTRRPLVLHLVSESQGGLKGFGGGDSRFSFLRTRIALLAARHASVITTTGYNTKKHLMRRGMDEERIVIAPSTTGSQSFFPLDIPKIYDMIMVTRLYSVKRIDIFLRVVKAVSEQRDVVAAIAGTGPLQSSMMDLSENLGISNIVRFLGHLPENEINLILNQSEVFLLTSQTEGFPKVIVEALCAGTPVVSADVGDIGSILTNQEDGFLVSPFDNIEQYTSYVLKLMDDEELRDKFSHQGQHLCQTTLSTKERISIIREVYSKIDLQG